MADAKYDRIGEKYDTSRRADPYLLSRVLHHLGASSSGKYLDLACGSGNYTSAMALAVGVWTGIDQSRVMLANARKKSTDVRWLQGAADHLPFSDDSFSGVTCTLAIHHFPSLERAFSEVRRVLEGGRFVLFTSTTEQMKGYWLSEYFPIAMRRSWNQMPTMVDIEAALEGSGLNLVEIEAYFIRDDLSDSFLYSGKRHPEIYLDANVRHGISTFSSLADESEIASGCSSLRRDIESGRINEVIASYDNDLGDYCFFVSD